MTSHNTQSGAGKKPKCARRETIIGVKREESCVNGVEMSALKNRVSQYDTLVTLIDEGKINESEFLLVLQLSHKYPNVHPNQILSIIDKRKERKEIKRDLRRNNDRDRDIEIRKNRDAKYATRFANFETEVKIVDAYDEFDVGNIDCVPPEEFHESKEGPIRAQGFRLDPTRDFRNPQLDAQDAARAEEMMQNWYDLEFDINQWIAATGMNGDARGLTIYDGPSTRWVHYVWTIVFYLVSGDANAGGFAAIGAMISLHEGNSVVITHAMHAVANAAIVISKEFYRQNFKKKRSFNRKKQNSVLETEGRISDAMNSLKDNFEYVFTSNVVSDLLTTITHLAAHKLFDEATARYIFDYLKPKPIERLTKPGLFALVWKQVTQLVAVAESLWAGTSLHDALEQFIQLEALEVMESKIVAAYPNVYPGIPPEGCYTEQYVYTMACKYIERAETRLINTQQNSRNFTKYNASLENVKGIRAKLEITLQGRTRMTPFGVILFGESHIGKSYFIKFLQQRFLEAFNIPYEPTMIYNRDYNQPHWEKYFGQPLVFFSELGTMAPSLAMKAGDPSVVEFCSLIDNNEKQLTMAFEGKGQTPFRSLGVFADGNNFNPEDKFGKHLNVEYTVSNPGAMFNRFILPTMKVKEEYRLPGSMSIDPDKARFNPDRWFDIYTFEIWESKKEGYNKVSFRKTFSGDIDHFDVVYKNKVLKHFMNQKQALENVKRALTEEVYGASALLVDPVEKIMRVINSVFEHVYNCDPQAPELLQGNDDVSAQKQVLRDWIKRTEFISDPNHVDLLQRALVAHLSNDKDPRVRELVAYVNAEDFLLLKQQIDQDYAELQVDEFEEKELPNPYETEMVESKDVNDGGESYLASLFYLDAGVPSLDWKIPDGDLGYVHLPSRISDCEKYLNRLKRELEIWIDKCNENPAYTDMVIRQLSILILGCQTYIAHKHMQRWALSRVPERAKTRLQMMYENLSEVRERTTAKGRQYLVEASRLMHNVKNSVRGFVHGSPNIDTPSYQLVVIWLLAKIFESPIYEILSQFSLLQYVAFFLPLVWLFFTKVSWISYFTICSFSLYLGITLLRMFDPKTFGSTRGFAKQLELRRRKFIAERILKARAGLEIAKTVIKPIFFIVGAASLATASVLFLKSLRKKKKAEINDANSFPVEEIPIIPLYQEGAFMSNIADVEEKTGCEIPYARVRNKLIPSQWTAVQTAVTGGTECASDAQFYDRIVRGRRKMLIVGKSPKTGDTIELTDCVGFGIKNYLFFPKHYIDTIVDGSIYVFAPDGKSGKTKIASTNDLVMCEVHTDLVAIKVYNLAFPDCSKDLPGGRLEYFRGKLNGVLVDCTLTKGIYVKNSSTGKIAWYTDVYTYKAVTYKGLCGEIITTNILNRYFIVGMHVAGNQSDSGAAVPLTSEMLRVAENFFSRDILTPLPSVPVTVASEDAKQFVTEGGFQPIQVRVQPHDKSCVNYEVLQFLQYHGRDLHAVSFPSRSKVIPTGLDSEVITGIFNRYGLFPDKEFVPPLMKSTRIEGQWINPINVNIRDMDRADHLLNAEICSRVVDEIVDVYVDRVRSMKGANFKLSPLKMINAINGMDHDKILRKIDQSKAGGYGYAGKKNKYFVEFEGESYPCDKLEADVYSILSSYSHGKSYPHIFKGTLKDEPRSKKKYLSGSTRMFFASSLPHLIVQRMYLAPLMTLKMELDGIFNSAIGIDAHRDIESFLRNFSDKAGLDFEYMMDTDEGLETDYRGFDKETCTMVTSSAYTIVAQICKKLGFNVEATNLLSAMLSDMIVAYFWVDGDIFSRPGIFGSGQYATAELNDFRNTFMIVYALHHLVYPYIAIENRRFDKILEHSTYGDDLLGIVFKPYRELFNNITYAEFCLRHYGVTCTPANKENVMSPFIPFTKASFLKRNFVRKNDLGGKFVGLLDVSSIRKTLLWYLPSDSISPLMQWKQMVESCMRELFFHLDEISYIKFGDELMTHIKAVHGVDCFWIPSYERIKISLTSPSDDGEPLRGALEVNNTQDPRSDSCTLETESSPIIRIRTDTRYATSVCRRLLSREIKTASRSLSFNSTQGLPRTAQNRVATSVNDKHIGDFKSGEISNDVVDTHQNLTDVSATPSVDNSNGRDTNLKLYKPVDVGLGDFLSRPIQISSYAIAHAVDSSVVLNPWDLYLAEPSVRAKLKNFGYMRAKLKTKVVVSGTPFHQGSLLVSKILYPGQVDSVVAYSGGSAFATRPMFLKFLTQTQGRGIMNLHDNIPFELEFPFVNPQPMGRLFDASSTAAFPAGSNFPDFTSMAKMYLYTLNQQLDTSGGATDVYVYVYAWLEDVVLGCLSASPFILTTEAPDERIVGPVEKFTSAAARYSRYFIDIPFISPFAKASEIAFGAISSVASIFGWSVPTVIEKPMRMKNEPFQNACQIVGYDTGQRLTLDPKQEITVDPAVYGVQFDELAIRHLSKIESLLDQFSWSTSASSMTPLWKTMVTPNARTPIVGAATRKIQPTVIDYITMPFRFWRGTIKFKIQVICTQFHRGKFAIIFEPDITKDALVAANIKLNKQFVKIIDISETQEVEFCVDWASHKMWLPVLGTGSDQTTGSTITTSQLPAYSTYVNGMIYVVPITKLQAPNATSAQINVFVSCDDLRVCYPDTGNLPQTMLLTEAPDEKTVHSDSTDMTLTPTTCMSLNPLSNDDSKIAHLTFGEEVHSFRGLLKKFFYSDAVSLAATAPTVHKVTYRVVPQTTPNPTANNTTVSNLFAHLRLCYLAMRGGLRKRFDIFGSQSGTGDSIRIAMAGPTATTSASGVSGFANDTAPNSLTGTVWFMPSTNAGLETELPYYSNNLFYFANNANEQLPSAVPNVETLALRNYVLTNTIGTNSSALITYREWTATAEDFSFGYFVGVPYYRSL